MTPVKKTLISSAAVIALMTGPALAQSADVSTDTSTSVESTLGDGEINSTSSVTADESNVEATAEAEADSDAEPLKKKAEDGVAAAGEAIEDTGDAAMDTAEAAGDKIEDGAEAAGDAAMDTAEAAGDKIEDGAEATAEAMSPDDAATADAEAEMTAEAGPTTAGTLIGSDVASSAGEEIGEIDDVVRINGEAMAVIGVGGFLGLGEHSVALPLTELDWQGETVTAFGYTEEQLKSMDAYDAELATKLEADEQVTLGKS